MWLEYLEWTPTSLPRPTVRPTPTFTARPHPRRRRSDQLICWPPYTNLKNWKIQNHLNISMLDIKWKLKTSALQRNMSKQVWGQITDLRLTFIDLWWPLNFLIWDICMMYIKRKLSTQGNNMRQPFFSVLDHLTSHDHDLTSYDLFWPFDLKNS